MGLSRSSSDIFSLKQCSLSLYSSLPHITHVDYYDNFLLHVCFSSIECDPLECISIWLIMPGARRALCVARLRMTEGLDAPSAAFEVGYESASQFNREYRRLFGLPPMRDIKTRQLVEVEQR
jgi:hypothetical protein